MGTTPERQNSQRRDDLVTRDLEEQFGSRTRVAERDTVEPEFGPRFEFRCDVGR